MTAPWLDPHQADVSIRRRPATPPSVLLSFLHAVHFSAAVILLLCPLLIAGCLGSLDATDRELQDARTPNTMPPHFATGRGPNLPRRSVMVFVHGVFGDAVRSWTEEGREPFWTLMNHDDLLQPFDVFVFGFQSDFLISASSLSVGEAVGQLANAMTVYGLTSYERIVLVAHSMGGLVVMNYLLDYPEVAARVLMVYLFSTPMEGSQLADLGQLFLGNPGLRDMVLAQSRGDNTSLDIMHQRWARARERQSIPPVYCAYETATIAGLYVVEKVSATRVCEGTFSAIPRNHIRVVKPIHGRDEAIIALGAALREADKRRPSMGQAPELGLYMSCDRVLLPIPVASGASLYYLDTSIGFTQAGLFRGFYRTAGAWPSEKYWSFIYKCELTNYGPTPLFALELTLRLAFRETIEEPDKPGRPKTSGKVVLVRDRQVSMPEPLASNGRFAFYVWNRTSQFVDIQFPQQAAHRPAGERERRLIRLLQPQDVQYTASPMPDLE